MQNNENEKIDTNTPSLAEAFGMKFNEDGSLSTATNLGNGMIFRHKNHKERRIEAAIERRKQKRIKKWGK